MIFQAAGIEQTVACTIAVSYGNGGIESLNGIQQELAELFRRDIARLMKEVALFQDETLLWRTLPGVTNSAGNLALHLEGNLREFVGRVLGGVEYKRERPLEFSTTGVPASELAARLDSLGLLIPTVIEGLTEATLDAEYPEQVLGRAMSARNFLIHLYGHLNLHLGQVNYLRRMLSGPE